MAVTAIWDVKGRIDSLVAYAVNPGKTTDSYLQETADLHAIERVVEYTADQIKTEKRMYVSGINCDPDYAAKQFRQSKKNWNQEGSIVAFHAYQSFKPGEVDAETAHKIGVTLAKELWGNRFEVVVATHLNTGHFHNHFVINSVSFRDGYRYYDNKESYRRMREVSDRLCREYQLSVIKNPGGRKKSYAEHQAEQQGNPTIRSLIRADIDRAIEASITEDEFFQVMAEMGYKFHIYTERGEYLKYPTIEPPGSKSRFRLHKLGEAYTFDGIAQRIFDNYSRRLPFPEERRNHLGRYRYQGSFRKRPKATGLRALYFYYCYQLKTIVKRPASIKKVSVALREDIIKLDRYIAETRFLGINQIETVTQLAQAKQSAQAKLESLYDMRRDIRNAQKRANRAGNQTTVEALKAQASEVAKEMRLCRKEVKMCDSITERSTQVQLNLEQIQVQKITQRKENERYEPSRRRSGTARENVSEWR